jgi:hypothetical protein
MRSPVIGRYQRIGAPMYQVCLAKDGASAPRSRKARKTLLHFARKLRRQRFVCIERQYPVVLRPGGRKLRCGPNPSHSFSMTRAPCFTAISCVPSVLPESMTSSAAKGRCQATADGCGLVLRAMTSSAIGMGRGMPASFAVQRTPRNPGECVGSLTRHARSPVPFDPGA